MSTTKPFPASRVVPVDIQFKAVERLKFWSSNVLWATTGLTPLISILDSEPTFAWLPEWYPALKQWLIAINCCLIAAYAVLEFAASYQLSNAERDRRLDFLDNALGTRYAGQTSIGYFTNEDLRPGIYKCLVNCFENNSHSLSIVQLMFPREVTKSLIVAAIFVLTAVFGKRELVRLFFELPLAAVVLQDALKLFIFKQRLAHNQETMRFLFNDMRGQPFDDGRVAAAMRDILGYETIISWAAIKLDSELFNKHWDELAQNWEHLKKQYDVRSLD